MGDINMNKDQNKIFEAYMDVMDRQKNMIGFSKVKQLAFQGYEELAGDNDDWDVVPREHFTRCANMGELMQLLANLTGFHREDLMEFIMDSIINYQG